MESFSALMQKRMLFSVFCLVVVALLLEFYLRIFVIRTPSQQFLEGIGMVPVSNSSAFWGVEGYGVTDYVANGEIASPENDGISVVVLGDSYTEALQVNNNEKYTSIAEEILLKNGIEMDLHNLGQSGRNVADYVYMAPAVNDLFSPSVVVIQIDRSDFLQSYNSSNTNFFDVNNHIVSLIHQDNFRVRNTFDVQTQNLIRKSSIISYLMYRFSGLADNFRSGFYNPFGQVENVVSENKYAPFDNEKILFGIQAIKDAYPNSSIMFLMIPNIPVIEAGRAIWENPEDKQLFDLINTSLDSDLIYPYQEFKNLYEIELAFPRGFFNTSPNAGHLNRDGHRAVANALAKALEGVLR